MTLFVDLSKSSPESIVDTLIGMCQSAAESGEVINKPVHVEFKKKVWIVTYINSFGEFAEIFKTKESAMLFMDSLLENGNAIEAKIRESSN